MILLRQIFKSTGISIILFFVYAVLIKHPTTATDNSQDDQKEKVSFALKLITAENSSGLFSEEKELKEKQKEFLSIDRSYIRIALFNAAYRNKDELYKALLDESSSFLENEDTRSSFFIAATKILDNSSQAILDHILKINKLKPSLKHLNEIAAFLKDGQKDYKEINKILSQFSVSSLPVEPFTKSELKKAIKEGNLKEVKSLLDKEKDDISKAEMSGFLFFAATSQENNEKNHITVVKELLSVEKPNIKKTRTN